MLLFILISTLLISIAAICEASMDKLEFQWHKSIFATKPRLLREDFWNPYFSWKNKYSNIETKEPKFFGSTTFLVFLTDGWHLFKFLKNLFLFLTILFSFFIGHLYNLTTSFLLFSLMYVVYLRIVHAFIFVLFFEKILQHKNKL
jgi:hypothetical protein